MHCSYDNMMREGCCVEIRVVIGGCRYYTDYNVFCRCIDRYLDGIKGQIIILSGHCSGVDTMAERYAEENGYAIEVYPAQWDRYGRAAGPKRNMEMVGCADKVVVFWDGVSKGTKNLIDCARKRNIDTEVFKI